MALCCSSCSDILDKSPLDLRTEEDVWSDPNLAQIYLNDLWYATVRRDVGNKIRNMVFIVFWSVISWYRLFLLITVLLVGTEQRGGIKKNMLV